MINFRFGAATASLPATMGFAALLLTSAAPTAVYAQTSEEPAEAAQTASAPGEIIVTARRREERLQDVPIAVTALGGKALETRGFQQITSIEQAAPNLQSTPGTGGKSGSFSMFIRGVGEYDFIVTSDPAVALYIDGVYVPRSFGANTQLLGIDRIEVLRGPQGSLFGKNTIGGAVNVTTHKPTGERSLEVDVMGGSYGTWRGRLNAETPLTDDLSLGVSVMGRTSDGWQKLDTGGALGDENIVAGRTTLRWQPEGLDAVLSVDGLHQRQNSGSHNMLAFQPTFFSILQSSLMAPCCTVPTSKNRTGSSDEVNHDDTDAFNATLTLDFDALGGSIKSISAYRWVSALFGRDGDASSAVNYAGDVHDERSRQLSQELQYSGKFADDRGQVLLGLYAFQEKSRDHTQLFTAKGLYNALVAATPEQIAALPFPLGGPETYPYLDFNVDFRNRQTTTNYAVFGNVNYKLTDALTLDLGGRYTWEKKKFHQRSTRIDAQIPFLAGVPEYTLEESWSNFSPKATLSYRFSRDIMGYATYSQGFRSGGFNGRPTSPEEIGSFDPEKLTSYEVGLKTELFDRKLRLNVDAFYNSYKNQQVLITGERNGIIVAITENAGKSRMWGFEGEFDARVTSFLTLNGSLGYLNSRYLRYDSMNGDGQLVDLSNLRLKHAPKWTANIGAQLDLPVTDNLDFMARVDAAYKSSSAIDTANSPLLVTPKHILVNGTIGLSMPDKGWNLKVQVENLTNRRILVEGFDAASTFGFVEGVYTPPRRVFATVGYRF